MADPVDRLVVVRMLAKGHSRRAAAEMVGCHVATIGRTAARDPVFRHALVEAEQTVTMQALEHVAAAAREPRYWRAGAWFLERTAPGQFGREPSPPFGPENVSELAQGIKEAIQPVGFSAEQLEQMQTRIEEFLTDAVAAYQADAPAKHGRAPAKSAGSQPPSQPTAPAASPAAAVTKTPRPPEPPARNAPPAASEKRPATQPAIQQQVTSPSPTAAQRATPTPGVARGPSEKQQPNGRNGRPLPWGLEDLTPPRSAELIGP